MSIRRSGALAAAILVALGLGCTDGGAGDVIGCSEGLCDEGNFGGLTPSEYFAELHYTIDRAEPETHKFLGVLDAIPVADPAGQDRRAEVDLFLLDDGSFILEYAELLERGDVSYYVREDRFIGAHNLVGNDLELEGVGIASAAQIDGTAGVVISFTKDLGSEGLTDGAAALPLLQSTWGLDECSGTTADPELCPIEL